MSAASDFAMLRRLPPAGAVAYLRGRKNIAVTHSWQDLWHEEHARQFTISRLTRADLLADIRHALEVSVRGDLSRRDWMRDTEQLLADAGWWGTKEVVDPATGKTVRTTFDAARLKLIFDTNTRQAAAAGQWERVQATKKTHPFLRYITKDDDRVRPAHRAWHNLVLPVDDPFWQTHWPPNGWRCRCRVVAMSQREYDSGHAPGGAPFNTQPPSGETIEHINRRTGEITRVPVGVDPGFDYNAGTRGTDRALEELVQTKLAKLPPEIEQAARADLAAKAPPPSTPDPTPWRAHTQGTVEGDWHDGSFMAAPQWLKEAVAKRGALRGGVVQQRGLANYSPAEDRINMGARDRTRLTDQGTWRHEYGHAMDRNLQNGTFYRSAAEDFSEAMRQDASDLVAMGGHGPKNLKRTRDVQARLQAAYADSAQELLQAPDKAQWLADRYARNGLDFVQVQAAMKAQTVFATSLQGVGLDARYARIVTAIEQRDAQGLMDALTGGWKTVDGAAESAKTFHKGTIGNLSDLLGSATSNKVSGRNKSGFGHPDAYYKRAWSSQVECFANLTCFYGDASPVWGQIIEAMTPRMAQLFKEIMG